VSAELGDIHNEKTINGKCMKELIIRSLQTDLEFKLLQYLWIIGLSNDVWESICPSVMDYIKEINFQAEITTE
jgi:hypothetical protein